MSSRPDRDARIVTRVGKAIPGDNLFRGFSVANQLAGSTGLWSSLSLAADGPRLGPDEAAILDDLAVCCLAADPRIWPLKISRLAASFGSAVTGVAIGMLASDGPRIGPQVVAKTASFMTRLAAAVPDDATVEQVGEILDAWSARGEPILGFGVPFRDRDERLTALRVCVTRRQRQRGRYWRLLEAANEHLEGRRGLPANIGAGIAAVLLDLGLRCEQMTAIQWTLFYACYWANAIEGAQQCAPALQRGPDERIRYVGAPARDSPRRRGALEP